MFTRTGYEVSQQVSTMMACRCGCACGGRHMVMLEVAVMRDAACRASRMCSFAIDRSPHASNPGTVLEFIRTVPPSPCYRIGAQYCT